LNGGAKTNMHKRGGITKSVSVILATAREDYPIVGLPNVHLLDLTLESLRAQTFMDFELIVVDALYDQRPDLFAGQKFHAGRLPFPVKHIPIARNARSDHGFWADHRRWNVCGALNTGILHAEGELLVRIDDCSEFGSDYLERFWKGYQKGFWPCAMHLRYLEGKPARLNDRYREIGSEAKYNFQFEPNREEYLKKLYREGDLIRDTRYELVKKEGGRKIGSHEWFYGYSSVPLKAALKVNGFNELFDGDKSLEDCDMGSRLWMAGYKNKFLLDIEHQVIEHEHKPLPEKLIDPQARPIKCNYAIYLLYRKKKRWKANAQKLSSSEIDFIRESSLTSPCTPEGCSHIYEDDCRGLWFDLWVRNQPLFDLKKERERR